jgi:transposase
MPTRLTEGEKTLIRVLYVEKQKNTAQIAEMMDRPPKTVQEWIKRLGIKRTDEVICNGKIYKRLSPAQEQTICDAVRDGAIPSEVAIEHNLPVSRIRSVLSRHNVQGPVQSLGYRYDRVFSPDEDAVIRLRVEAGESRRAIAKEYGVKEDSVRAACTRAGLPIGLSAKEQAKRNKVCERIAVRSTLTIEQTAQVLDCSEKLVRQARI